jgi:hypothetical protein
MGPVLTERTRTKIPLIWVEYRNLWLLVLLSSKPFSLFRGSVPRLNLRSWAVVSQANLLRPSVPWGRPGQR